MSSHHMLDDGGLDNIKLQLHQHSKAILNSLNLEDCLAEEVVRNFEWYNEYCQSAYEALLQVHLKGTYLSSYFRHFIPLWLD